MKRIDIRSERTERAIENALLDVLGTKHLAEVGVSEVVKRAGISRSTFYTHFNNLDEVVDQIMARFGSRTRTLQEQLACAACEESVEGKPFCHQLREAGEFAPLVSDPQFLSRAIEMFMCTGNDTTARQLEDAGVPADVAGAISRFQLCGCYAVATYLDDEVEWNGIQTALDTFISGGLRAVAASYR